MVVALRTKIEEDVEKKLIELNEELIEENIVVRAFYLEEDEELEGTVANVIYVVTQGEALFPMETIDKYCHLVSKQLEPEIVFTYCLYRTQQEYQEDFQTDYWINLLNVVPAGVLQPA